jgi:hypothetical protein
VLAPIAIPARRNLTVALNSKAFEVRLSVNALLREGSIIKLDSDREGGSFVSLR